MVVKKKVKISNVKRAQHLKQRKKFKKQKSGTAATSSAGTNQKQLKLELIKQGLASSATTTAGKSGKKSGGGSSSKSALATAALKSQKIFGKPIKTKQQKLQFNAKKKKEKNEQRKNNQSNNKNVPINNNNNNKNNKNQDENQDQDPDDEENENIQNMIDMIDDSDDDQDDAHGDDNQLMELDHDIDMADDDNNGDGGVQLSNNFEDEYTDANQQEYTIAKKKKLINLLPIKTKDGDIIQRSTEVDVKDDADIAAADDDDDADQGVDEEPIDSDEDIIQETGLSNKMLTNELEHNRISTADLLILREQEIARQKYRIGIICSGILEKPDDKMKNFTTLFELMDPTISTTTTNTNERTEDQDDKNPDENNNKNNKKQQHKNQKNQSNEKPQQIWNLWTIRKIATISILEVFKDILPEYRIGQLDLKMQTVRKTTMERITYENSLLYQFKKYLQKLEKITSILSKSRKGGANEPKKMMDGKRRRTPEQIKLAEIGVKCLCELIIEHSYFNFGQNIAQLLVYLINCNFPTVRQQIQKCFEEIFKQDRKFDLTLYIIRRLNHLIKSKSNNVHVEVLNCLLALQIKSINLDVEKENEIKQKKLEAHRARLMNLSKKEKKRQKRLQQIDKELQETHAEENKQTKHFKLTEITKMLFTIYFRILKNDPNTKLLSATLEGLAEFAHVINIDFFSDLVEVLNTIMETQELGYREQLHCIQTVFTILSGQGEILNIDPLRFYGHLYRNLLIVNAGLNHTDIRIIIKTLMEVLIKRRKNINQLRLLAFLKRILTLSMQLLHNGTIGCLAIVKTIMQLSSASSLDILLDMDSGVGSGRYNPELMDPEYCNANCTAAYELSMLCRHYHPIVRKMAGHICLGVPASGVGSLPSELGKLSPIELYEQYDSTEMSFNPAVPSPKPITNVKPAKGRFIFKSSQLEMNCRQSLSCKLQTSNDGGLLNFYDELKMKK